MSATLDVDLQLPLERFALAARFTSTTSSLGVFGASGAGKTSLLDAIVGLRPAATGVVRVGDETWLDSANGIALPPERRDVGYVPQGAPLFPHLDVRANVRVGERRARARGRDVARTFAETSAMLELGPLLSQSVETLSGGERQRIALARAICSAPRLLVLDEPLSSIDLASRARLLPFLRRLGDELTVPMIVVSHAPLELGILARSVVVIDRGRVVDQDATDRIFARAFVDERLGHESLATTFPSTSVASEAGRTRVRLGGTSLELEVRASGVAAGRSGLCTVPADAVILSLDALARTSASNVLRGEVIRLDQGATRAVAHVSLDPSLAPLLVEVVPATVERLALAPGVPVHVAFKASSVGFLD